MKDALLLVERLKAAGDLSDKRMALDSLRELSTTHPTEVGQQSMKILTDILQAGIADGGMTQTIIQIILNLVTERTGGQRPGVGANIAIILMDSSNVQSLLDLMENEDTGIATTAIHVLQTVQQQASSSLEACVLECPQGMQRLIDALADSREVVRNDVIILLKLLTATNPEVKKYVAFQEGLERLFVIMSREGMISGSSVVADCLGVCVNVIRNSSVAQSLFCQSRCLGVLHQLIDVRWLDRSQTGEDGSVPADEGAADLPELASPLQVDIMLRSLELMRRLLGMDEKEIAASDLHKRQDVMGTAGQGLLVELLTHVAFSRAQPYCRTPSAVRQQAMELIGEIASGHTVNQLRMNEMLVQDLGYDSAPLPALLMNGALNAGDSNLREIHHRVLEACFSGNELACTQVVSHVIAPPPPPADIDIDLSQWVPPTPPGKVLLEHMRLAALRREEDALEEGCSILSMLLSHGGAATKEIALRIPMAPVEGEPALPLMTCLMRWLETALQQTHNKSRGRLCSSLLQLLCRWLYACPTACAELLKSPSNLFLVDLCAQKNDSSQSTTSADASTTSSAAVIRGLACLVMGIVLENAPDGEVSGSSELWNRSVILGMLDKRVGIYQFTAAIEAVCVSYDQQLRAWRSAVRDKGAHDALRFPVDPKFMVLLEATAGEVRKRIIHMYTGGTDGGAINTSSAGVNGSGEKGGSNRSMELIQMQEREIKLLKDRLLEALSRVPAEPGGVPPSELALISRLEKAEAAAQSAAEAVALVPVLQKEVRGLNLGIAAQERLSEEKEVVINTLRRQLMAGSDVSERERQAGAQIETLRAELSARGAQEDRLRLELGEAHEALEVAEEQAAEMKARLHRLEEEITVLRMSASSRSDLEHTVLRSSEHQMELEAALAATTADLDNLHQECSSLRAANESANALTARVSSESTGLRSECQRLQGEVDALRKHLMVAANGGAIALQELEMVRGRAASEEVHRECAAAAETARANHASELSALRSSLEADWSRKVKRMEGEVEAAKGEVVGLQRQVQAWRERVEETDTLAQRQSLELQQLKTEFLSVEVRARDSEAGRLRSEAAAEKSATELTLLKKRLEEVEQCLKTAQDQLRLGNAPTQSKSMNMSNGVSSTAASTVSEDLAELRQEHDDLLGLLAQQEVMKNTLAQALTRIGGRNALGEALQLAKRTATEQYGAYIDYDGEG